MLTHEQMVNHLSEKFTDAGITAVVPENGDAFVSVQASALQNVVQYIKENDAFAFDYLVNVSAWDSKEDLEVVYHFYSYTHRHNLLLKVKLPRQGGRVKTLAGLYGTANWQEREVYDHFGIVFEGHPDLRRILLPDDWVGHPLLKDYVEQEDYNGIGTTRPSML